MLPLPWEKKSATVRHASNSSCSSGPLIEDQHPNENPRLVKKVSGVDCEIRSKVIQGITKNDTLICALSAKVRIPVVIGHPFRSRSLEYTLSLARIVLERQRFDSYELAVILRDHTEWTKSEGSSGKRANLSWADLHNTDLSKVNLGGAEMRGASIVGSDLRGAFLMGANFSGAILAGANLSGADLRRANLTEADLRGAVLEGSNLSGARLVKANLTGSDLCGAIFMKSNLTKAILSGSRVYGMSLWDIDIDEETEQYGLVITPHHMPRLSVDYLEVAQFVYLLIRHQNLYSNISTAVNWSVLVVGGGGSDGRAVLDTIASGLRVKGYLPIVLEYEKPDDHENNEILKTLVGMARFVILDLSSVSVSSRLTEIVMEVKIPFVSLLEDGKKPSSVLGDLQHRCHWVIQEVFNYSSLETIERSVMEKIIPLAESKSEELILSRRSVSK